MGGASSSQSDVPSHAILRRRIVHMHAVSSNSLVRVPCDGEKEKNEKIHASHITHIPDTAAGGFGVDIVSLANLCGGGRAM